MSYALATNGFISLGGLFTTVTPTPTTGQPTVTATVHTPAASPVPGQTRPTVRVVVPTVKVKP